jgi:SAM-dependent methyltransferase
MDLKETDILGADIENHWYYQSKAKAMMRLLGGVPPKEILDVGAGSGYFSRYLLSNTKAAAAWCVDTSYAADTDEDCHGHALHFRRSLDTINADLVLVMDVLEHVDDDVGLLKEYASKVPSGSRFLMTVPAFKFLWSGHDDFLEHKNRYTLKQLEDVARQAGLRVRCGAYYFGMVFPIAAILRMAQKLGLGGGPARSQLTRHGPIVNSLLKAMCSVELPVMRMNRTAGLTAICLADKA